jgi:hypothetical protein
VTLDPAAFLASLAARPAPGASEGVPRVSPDDAERIRDLPLADYADPEFVSFALAWCTLRWSRGPDAPMQFRPVQAVALLVAHMTGGALLPIGTGFGKTLVVLLAADALGARRPLLLVPPALRVSLETGRAEYDRSFRIPRNLRVMAYSQLSVASSTDALERLAPDVIVCDEAHNLRHLDAARTRRVERYFKRHPEARGVFASGTLTSKSVRDYAHLGKWSLREGSPAPLPEHFPALQAFANVLDAKPVRKDGDSRYVAGAQPADFARFSPLFPDWLDYDGSSPEPSAYEEAEVDPQAERVSPRVREARARFQARLRSTPGVVATSEASVGCSLLLIERPLEVPASVAEQLAELDRTWCRPDGEELVLAIDVWRCGRQLSQGFYYRWKWPDGERDVDWLRTRAGWHRAMREVIGPEHLDSPLLVTMAARRALEGEENAVSQREGLLEALRQWTPHSKKRWRGQRTPPTETVWVDRFLVDDAVTWFKEHPLGLLWYSDHAIVDALAEAKVPVFGAGTDLSLIHI